MNRIYCFRIKYLLVFLSLVLLPVLLYSGVPKDVSGVINQVRARVTAVGTDYVILDDVTGFAPGDTVLVIQMKGVAIINDNNSNFGEIQDNVGDVGYYEFIIIQLVESGPLKITFYNNLKGGYNAESFVQLVKVESYETLKVTGELTCPDWDITSGTGGVLALFASDKVELYSDINVSGKGFRGGLNAPITGTCVENIDSYFFSEANTRSGRKGEGFASHDKNNIPLVPGTYARGIGAIATGGGGGDGRLAGGGGGGGYGFGGLGGVEYECSEFTSISGKGGKKITAFYGDTTLIMGGGGGASGFISGSAPNGGNGGGIIFIMTDSIYSFGGSIRANGQSASFAANGAGGAGGGAAGSIVISSNGYGAGGITIQANGGSGSNAATGNEKSIGGGGSGGFIWISPSDYSKLTTTVIGGHAGNFTGSSASDGDNGFALKTNLQMRLNGFLFNTVVTENDGNLLDSICLGQIPRPLKASVPVGGKLPFSIYWEKSYSAGGPWVSLSGTLSGTVFTPAQPEAATIWIRRRIVDSSSPTAIEDISKSVKVIVHPLIYDFEIDNSTGDTICYGQTPLTVDPLVAIPGGGNGIYNYDWKLSTDGTLYYQTVLGTAPSFSPPALTFDTWYRRTVSSGACVDSTSAVKFRVLPVIENNVAGPDQTICEGDLFAPLSTNGSPVIGGDGIYRYTWEASLDNIDFTHTIEGVTDQANYDPDELSTDFPALTPKYYRRIIYSGEADCCVDISPTVSLVMQPAIANNSLSILSQSICEGVPGASDVIGTTPSGGTAVYTYMWEERILPSGPWIFNDSTRKDLLLGSRIFTNSTSFRRIVISGECTDISVDEFVVTVEPKITGNLISILSGVADTIICSGQDPSLITGPEPSGGLGSGSYSYLWEDSTASHDWQSAPLTNSAAGYDPGILTGTTWYRRRAFSGECESTSNTVKITILPVIAGNTVGSDQFVCFGTAPALLDGTTTVGGGDGTYYYLWESDDDIAFASPVTEGTQAGFQPGDLTAPVYYRRTVYSGLSDCCQDISSAISIGINQLPVGVITALQDEAICQGEEISFSLSVTSGAAPYNVVLNDGTADQSLDVTTTGTLVHQLTPAYTTDKTLDYILYSIEDANACLATSLSGSKHVDFYEIPASYAGPADQQCGHDYSLGAEASVGVGTWSWDGPAVIFDDVNNPNSGVTIPGIVGGDEEFVFWWKEVNVLSRCADSASATVHFWMDPTVADAGNDSTLLPFQRDVLLYANQPIFGTGMWTILEGGGNMRTGDGDNPEGSLQGMTDGLNIVEWKISNGICDPSIDQVELFVPAVRLISGFSPNNDGINDFFEIKGLVEWDGDVVDNELIVTDMTGVVLFQEQNYANDWDGRDMRGNPLPSGTYYYFINVFYSKKEQLKGFVVIKRD